MAIRYKVINWITDSSVVINSKSMLYTHYRKGTILEDKKGIGFFCFKTLKNALTFQKTFPLTGDIIKVKTLDTGFVPKIINKVSLDGHILSEFHGFIPEGTICHKKIKVLE